MRRLPLALPALLSTLSACKAEESDTCDPAPVIASELAGVSHVRDCGTTDDQDEQNGDYERQEANDCVMDAIARGEAFRAVFLLPSHDSERSEAFVRRGASAPVVHIFRDTANRPALTKQDCDEVRRQPNCVEAGATCLLCEGTGAAEALCSLSNGGS